MKASKTTQLETAKNLLCDIQAHFERIEGDQLDYDGLYETKQKIEKLLKTAGNEVDSDRTLGMASCSALVDVVDAVRNLSVALERAFDAVKKP